ncbi:MAG TPA: family 20 glycosylhydrolase [Terriglobia bacterium]|nr:family 20 glycosylhydrolase [Terriglobia bacterium]
MNRASRRHFLQTLSFGLAAFDLTGSGSRAASGRRREQENTKARLEPLRGLMVDAARLPEKSAYYMRLIDFCSEWNLNALLFRLTDDQGSALRFPRHPELVTHLHALSPEEAHGLAQYGGKQGVTVIPEIESFGHSRYITATHKYAHLADSQPGRRNDFVGLCPVDPEALALMRDLYREVAEIFPSPYLHAGCDEVNWGGSELSRRALKTKSRAEIWAQYLNSLNDICLALGKEMIVWGDYVVHKEPAILPRISKRIIVMDWQYYVTDPNPLAQAAQEVMNHGLRVIGAPAIISCEWGPRAGELQLRNIDAYADAYLALGGSTRCLGVIVTNWAPTRYLQRSLWDTFAYAAVDVNHGSRLARQSAFRRFTERFYGASWDDDWQEAFSTYYRITPNRHSCAPEWPGPRLPVPWANEASLRQALMSGPTKIPPYKQLRARMAILQYRVRRNEADFASLAPSAEYIEYAYWRDMAARTAAKSGDTRPARALIRKIAEQDRQLVERLNTEWNVGRFADSPGKLDPLVALGPANQLLFRMRQAAEFSTQLAAHDAQFFGLPR